MNRTILAAASVFGASSLLLLDCAVKGTALLMMAAIAAMILRRDSAATRHLVWLLAIVAMLVVPVLSAMLPQWRVLPEWAVISPQPVVVNTNLSAIARPADGAAELPQQVDPVEFERPSATASQPAAQVPVSRPALVTPEIIPHSADESWNWIDALPLLWAIGFSVLTLRLLAARLVLWNGECGGTVLWSSKRPATSTPDPIVTALEAARLQIGICRPVTLLIHPDRTIPVVWGVIRCRLLLPVAARHWSAEQLRSVLLHELAHIKRRDTVAQLLTQIACALHWFNPLVWFAAWRLGVERERACDDLVLASGVRPSAYAGHLLEIVTGLTPTGWTQACALAMARKSSLEGRLVAVLNENLNRRGVSVALAAIALAIAAGVAVPIAMLRAADERPGAPMEKQPQKTKDGEKLDAGTEKRLKWGEPVNGLRAALIIRPAPGEPKVGDMPDLYLVLQNVSDAPLRLSDADVPANVDLRVLYHKIDGQIKDGLGAREPALGDLTLQPREVVFLPMFIMDPKRADGRTVGSMLAEYAIKDTHQTLVAHLKIEKAPAGAWTGKVVTGETSGAAAAGQQQPKTKEAKALFKMWQENARINGDIPAGFVARLGDKVKEFIRNNSGDASGDPYAKKMAPLVPRFDDTRDRKPAEIVALLDDIATACTIPLETTMEEAWGRTISTGVPLPKELANAPWGEPQANGLRTAWLLEPRAAEHRLGTPLKSRILFHNSGKDAVVFRTLTWRQTEGQARDAKGEQIKVDSIFWTTLSRVLPYRLAPGEYIEVIAAGIGVGKNTNEEDWQNTRVGSWIDAKAGDEVTFTPGAEDLSESDMFEAPPLKSGPDWWPHFIAARLALELPLPADPADRTRLLDRAVRELFGTAPTAEETAAFLADRNPNALDTLSKRLAQRTGITPFSGTLKSGPTTFRVLPVDPNAAKKPRTASNPGHYTLGATVGLVVTRRPDGERIVNEAKIEFYSDPGKPLPGKPCELKLPDGYNTWAAAWVRGTTVLWVLQKGNVRSYDFTNPAQVKETTFDEPVNFDQVPQPILDALRGALGVPGTPKAPK